MTLPTFLIIGTHKGASTSLRVYLGAHPDVYVAPAEEPSFFALDGTARFRPDGSLSRPAMDGNGACYTLDEYEALFDGVTTEKAIGEKSPAYLMNPDAPHRIKKLIPDVRLIAVLRNPIDRAYSHYLMEVRIGWQRLPFDEVVATELRKMQTKTPGNTVYVRAGKYAKRVDRYLTTFDPDQLRIYLYEDLLADMPSVIREMYEHIGVDPSFEPDLTVRWNSRPSEPRQRTKGSWPRELRRSLAMRRTPQPSLDGIPSATRQELLDFYRPDILQLQTMIGRDLSGWLE